MKNLPPLRIVFMGTPEIAATVLTQLATTWPGQIIGVVSQPDRPKGRDLAHQPTAVKTAAQQLGLPVWQPEKARSPESMEMLRSLAPDVIVVLAYGQLLPPDLLAIPRLGCLNIHTSLLPRWRGAAPIQWALAAGDAVTGVTLMRMDAGLDTGPILATRATEIRDDDTGQTLHDRLGQLGAALLIDSLPGYAIGQLPAVIQSTEGVTYARKITREDGRMDWTLASSVLWRRLRAFTPWPGAFTTLPRKPKARLLKLHTAVPVDAAGPAGQVLAADASGLIVACGAGALRITELQPEGGRRMTAAEFLAGHHDVIGAVLS